MRLKTKIYALLVFAVAAVIVIGYFVLWTDRNFKVYNDNFKVLDYGISEGKTHTVYKGNQTVGRIRARLKHKFGLKFIGESPASMAMTPGVRVFLLIYKGDFPFEELDDLRAVLTNDKDIFKELAVMKMFALDESTFIRGCILPILPACDDSFRIDFKLKSSDNPIASCRAGKLYKHNNNAQSDPRTSNR
jgi:hypothetical protein